MNAWYQDFGNAFGERFDIGFRIATIPDHPGDFDLDGDVNGRDFLAWQRNPSIGDLADWQANYGAGAMVSALGFPPAAEAASPAASSVAEPGSVMLVGIFAIVTVCRRGTRGT